MVETRAKAYPASAAMDVDAPVKGSTGTATEADNSAAVLADIKAGVLLLMRGAKSKEARYVTRVVRGIANFRKKLTPAILSAAIEAHIPATGDAPARPWLVKALEAAPTTMDVDSNGSKATPLDSEALPEIEAYLGILVLVHLFDSKKNAIGLDLSSKLVGAVVKRNQRSLDQLLAKIFFYHSLFHEIANKLSDLRAFLLSSHRTAVLRRDEDTQATILNLLLRNYLHYNLYDQAAKLAAKASFPENASNNQLARYYYYLGRIKAIQLDYTDSHTHLLQAIRKAPQNAVTAGFQQAIHIHAIIVQLLMGEIPERNVFRQKYLTKALLPYFHLTQAVRIGDLNKFQDTLAKYTAKFRKDKTYTLILRLRHNVIKTGIRMISLSYSKISLKDISTKLHLGNEEDAEFIVAKAIRDGVIDATIDHAGRYVKSKEVLDIYSTNEPQAAFHQRINFCLATYNDSVKALRFPENDDHLKDLEAIREIEMQEKDIINEIENNEFDADGDMDDF